MASQQVEELPAEIDRLHEERVPWHEQVPLNRTGELEKKLE